MRNSVYKRVCIDRAASSALEFAIVAPVFLVIVFSIIEVSYKAFLQTEIDHIAFNVSMNMARESSGDIDKEDYKRDIVCGSSSLVFVDCDKILFGASAFPNNVKIYNRINDHFVDYWYTGCGGSTVIVEILYPVIDIVFPITVADIVNYNGRRHMRSRGMVRREPLVIGSGRLDGGVPC